MIRALRFVATGILLVAIAAYAVAVVRDFSRYADYYPYLSVDDALANVSYSLAHEGRYAYLASPLPQSSDLTPRNVAFYNYGPWYFYAGAGLITLFGYSVTLLRGLHLIGMLCIVSLGFWWLRREGSLAAGALLAYGLLQAFEVTEWPMIRPDIAVSVFAAAFIVAASGAMRRPSAWKWGVACAAAGCAAFSHLIAWALVPCAFAMLGAAVLSERPGVSRSIAWCAGAGAGLGVAAIMFYGSFGFRVGDHLEFIFGYRRFLDESRLAGTSYAAVLVHYLHLAFDYLTAAQRLLISASAAVATLVLAVSWRRPKEERREIHARLLAPTAVLVAYALSLGTYGNEHSGYLILLHVAGWWCAAAAMGFAVWWLSRASRTAGSLAELAVAAVLLAAAGVRLFAAGPPAERLERVGEWASITDYTKHVQALIPAGSTVWGNVMFGIESPERLQLIQLADGLAAVATARRLHTTAPADVAPQFLVWAYSDRHDAVEAEVAPPGPRRESAITELDHLLPDVRYRLAGMVVGNPYGVTRVYAALTPGAKEPAAPPDVHAYDPAAGVWDTDLDGPIDTALDPIPAIAFSIGPAAAPDHADRSVALTLPAGRYLLRVHVRQSATATRRMLAVTDTTLFEDRRADIVSAVDFASYFSGDSDVYLFHDHDGGPLYVSQFDDGEGASIEGVGVYTVAAQAGAEVRAHLTFWDLPPLPRWLPSATTAAGVHAKMDGDALVVDGNASHDGYQIQAPPVAVPPGSHVTVRTDFSGEQSVVCVGALNGAGDVWLRRSPLPSRGIRFDVDASAAFRLTFYNCNPSDGTNPASRFSIRRAQFAVEGPLAVDRWMALLRGERLAAPTHPDFRVRAVPPGRTLSPADLAGPSDVLTGQDLVFQAPIATRSGTDWKITGRAAGDFAYALVLKPKLLLPGQRLFARGRVDAGGVTFGLQQKGAWVAQIDVTTPGEFIVAIEAPHLGRYTTVVAHYLTDPALRTDVTISQLGFIGR